MTDNPIDPLQALSAALSVPAGSKEQADLLSTLRESLEAHPSPIPVLCTTLLKIVPGAGDSLLKRWVLDLLQFAISRSTLSLDARTQLALNSLDTLSGLISDPNLYTVRAVIQTLTSAYPLLFRMLCTNRNMRPTWDTLVQCKTRIFESLWSPTVSVGVKLSAVKFLQRVILVQTRGVSDPRLQNKNDPNISFCPADHPFISVPALEAEGKQLLEASLSLLYTSQNTELLSAMINSLGGLAKSRPSTVQFIIGSLKQWNPACLLGLSASSVRSVEKTIRIVLVYVARVPQNAQYIPVINEILAEQALRMERAVAEERRLKTVAALDSRKRPFSVLNDQASDNKRPKLDKDSNATASASFLAAFDFTSLPAALITELIVANIGAFTEPTLVALVQAYRQSRLPELLAPVPTVPTAAVPQNLSPETSSTPAAKSGAPPPSRLESVDPLQMDIDEELEYEPDKLNLELSGLSATDGELAAAGIGDGFADGLEPKDFKLPPPGDPSENDRIHLMRNSASRMLTGAIELVGGDMTVDASQSSGHPTELWMLLLVRMVTRVTEPAREMKKTGDADGIPDGSISQDLDFYSRHDQLRQTLVGYIMTDFPSRVRLATTWMNEEWYNDRVRGVEDPNWRSNYDTWLNQIVVSYQTLLDGKDRTFSRFLLDLPSVPNDVLILLRELCVDADRMQAGFTTLREFVVQRPSLRAESLKILLELTTHPEKVTRGAAIITVKRWVPDVHPMDGMIRAFALQMLRKLQSRPSADQKAEDVQMNDEDQDENMEDGQLPPEALVQTPYLPERIELPAQKAHVLQHVELLFALSVKVPEFLDEIFAAYGQMDITVQEAIQELITALIKSLGSSHGKLLTLMRTCPRGAKSLALRVLTIFTEHGRPSSQLVALVKGLINERERDLDARFLIPIIAEMDKPDIMRYLPRIVSILNGQSEPKNLVRSVFSSIVTTPAQTFGSVTSNLPRVRQSELLTPAELMVLLHESEKEIGLKSAMEAVGICFSMTDVFRSEILAVVMQQIVDEPNLPVLFLRTVIQAVTTYKSLVGFVSTTLLSRLITKKIWTNPHLWEGFIRCAKAIAPASFGALLQLPKDQLRELVDKQPSLKSGLRDYVTKKSGNRARVSGFLDIFGGDESNPNPGSIPQPDLAVTELPG